VRVAPGPLVRAHCGWRACRSVAPSRYEPDAPASGSRRRRAIHSLARRARRRHPTARPSQMMAAYWGIGRDCVGFFVLIRLYLAVISALLRRYEGQSDSPDPMRPGRTGRAPPAGTGRVAGIRRRPGSCAPCMMCGIGPFVAVVVPLGSPPGAVIVAGMVSSPGTASPFLTSSSPPIRPDLVSSPMSIGNFLAVRRTFLRNLGISRQPLGKREDGHYAVKRVTPVFPGPMRPGRTGRPPPHRTGRVGGI
jgi:hypothetical protein